MDHRGVFAKHELEAGAGWKNASGSAATEQELRNALGDLTALQIRWVYSSTSAATGKLDNIVFGAE
jgi:hypothetical protein